MPMLVTTEVLCAFIMLDIKLSDLLSLQFAILNKITVGAAHASF